MFQVCHVSQEQEAENVNVVIFLSRPTLLSFSPSGNNNLQRFRSLHTPTHPLIWSLLEMTSLSQVTHKLSQPYPCMAGLGASCCLSAGLQPLKRSEMCLSDTFLASCITIQPAIRYPHLPSSISLSSFLSIRVRQTPPFIPRTERCMLTGNGHCSEHYLIIYFWMCGTV